MNHTDLILLSITDASTLRDFETGMPQGDLIAIVQDKIQVLEITRGGSVCKELRIKTKLSDAELDCLCSYVCAATEEQIRKSNAQLA